MKEKSQEEKVTRAQYEYEFCVGIRVGMKCGLKFRRK